MKREEHEAAPDLQKLVEQFGGYKKITPEAWAKWDEENEAYRERLNKGLAYRKAFEQRWAERRKAENERNKENG